MMRMMYAFFAGVVFFYSFSEFVFRTLIWIEW